MLKKPKILAIAFAAILLFAFIGNAFAVTVPSGAAKYSATQCAIGFTTSKSITKTSAQTWTTIKHASVYVLYGTTKAEWSINNYQFVTLRSSTGLDMSYHDITWSGTLKGAGYYMQSAPTTESSYELREGTLYAQLNTTYNTVYLRIDKPTEESYYYDAAKINNIKTMGYFWRP